MRRKYGLKSYIWKAELQARGQLHYHITTNTWINWNHIRNEWNYLLRINNLMDEYILENGNDNPNSTDIHKVYKIKDVASYLSKYISKDLQKTINLFDKRDAHTRYSNDVVEGCIISCMPIVVMDELKLDSKVWDCSLDIKLSKLPNVEIDYETNLHLKSLKMQSLLSDTATDFCNILKPIDRELSTLLPSQLHNAKLLFHDTVRNTSQSTIASRKKKGKCEVVYQSES